MSILRRAAFAVATFALLSVACVGVAQADYLAEPGPLADFEINPFVPTKWGGPIGTGATVSYSFVATGVDLGGGEGAGTYLGDFMAAGWEAVIDSAFAAWSDVANITFTKVVDHGLAGDAAGADAIDIRIAGHGGPGGPNNFGDPGGVLAHAYFPNEQVGDFGPGILGLQGDLHFDTADLWSIPNVGPGFSLFQVAAHEIGHAIGLDHELTLTALMNPFYTEAFFGPIADDIDGAQYLYGAKVVDPVPEPGTIALLGLGVLGLGIVRRRRNAA